MGEESAGRYLLLLKFGFGFFREARRRRARARGQYREYGERPAQGGNDASRKKPKPTKAKAPGDKIPQGLSS
jgi:hypothetical protein